MTNFPKNEICNSGINRNLGRKIRKVRQDKGLSLESVASELGITSQQLGKYERGEARIVAETLFKLAQIFNIPFERFFADISPEEKSFDELLKEIEFLPKEVREAFVLFLRENRKFINQNYQKISE
jgi:transcriptional regulator with XRE-family HTH domain